MVTESTTNSTSKMTDKQWKLEAVEPISDVNIQVNEAIKSSYIFYKVNSHLVGSKIEYGLDSAKFGPR